MERASRQQPTITIDGERCKKDGLCVRVCPKVFEEAATGSVPEVARPEFCNDCGHCLLVCPAGAITHAGLAKSMVSPVEGPLLPSYEQVREMVRTRRSMRNFLDRPVERELIGKVIDGARFAPSAKNTQSTEFIVIDDREMLREIAVSTATWLGRMAARLKNPIVRSAYRMRGMASRDELDRWTGQFELIAKNMEKGVDTILYGAPSLVLFHAMKRTRFAEANANLALQNATFTACSIGLGSFYTGYVVSFCAHERKLPRLLAVPKGHRVYAGLAVGHPRIVFSRWIDRNEAKIRWI